MAETKKTPSAAKKRRKKKLSKQLRPLILVGAILVLLLIVLLLVVPALQRAAEAESSSSSSSSQVESTAAYLVNTEADNIASVDVVCTEDDSMNYLIKRIGSGVFDIPLLKGYDLKQDDLNTLGASFKYVFASQTVEDNSNPADYGLDKPCYTFAYTFRDETEPVTVEVGNQVPGSTYYYGRVQGEDTIYVLTGVSGFMVNPVDYVSTTVSDQPSDLFTSSGVWDSDILFDSIDLTGTGLEASLHCEQEDMSQYSSKITSTTYRYYVTDGVRRSLLNTSIEEVLQGEAVFGLEADSVVALSTDEETLAKYGLDEPYKQLDLSVKGRTYTYKCSPIPDEEGYYYLVRNGLKAIFRVSGETLTWAEYDYLAIASAIIFAPYIDDTETIRLDFGDGVEHVLKSNCPDVSTDLAVTYNGSTEIDPANYRTFFSLIIYSSADEFLTGDEDLSVDPILTITYVQQDGTTDVVKFIPISARSVAIEYNGEAQFYMRAEFIDKIERELENLVNGEKVTATW